MKLRVAVAPDTPVSECERILVEQGEGCIPVVENFDAPRREWRMAGLVTRATILKTHEYYRSRRLSAEPRGVEKKEGDAASSPDGETENARRSGEKKAASPERESDAGRLGSGTPRGGGENAREQETASIDATKFPPGLVPGEVPRAPRVTFDEHLFFSQDELDKVRAPTKGAFDALKDLAENAPRAGPKTSGTETDASSS